MSRSEAPRTEWDLFAGTGAWTPCESDREGMRCACQEQDTIAGPIKMHAYFAASGALAALSVTTRDGQTMEFDPAAVAAMAAQQLGASSIPGRAKSFTRR